MDSSSDDPVCYDASYKGFNEIFEIIADESADNSGQADDAVSIRDKTCYSTKDAAQIVLNNNNNCVGIAKCSGRFPKCLPDVDSPKVFVYVVRAPPDNSFKPLNCTINILCPCSCSSGSLTIKYFTRNENNNVISTEKAAPKVILQPHHSVLHKYYKKHHKFGTLAKTVFQCETDSGLLSEKDNFVVGICKFSGPTKLQEHGNLKKNKTPLVHIYSPVKEQYQIHLKNIKPIEARKEVVLQNGGYGSAPADILISRKDILAKPTEDRILQSSSGRSIEIDFNVIESIKKVGTFVQETGDGNCCKRFFLTIGVAIANYKKNGLIKKGFVIGYQTTGDEAMNNPKRLLVVEKAEDRYSGAVTFNTSLLTLVYFTNPHIRKKDGQIVCAMLSEKRYGQIYLWMGQQLAKLIDEATKVCRSLVYDGMDVPSTSHRPLAVLNADNAINQDFSIPSSIIYYMKKYPSTWKVYLKLIKTCKHFYSKNDPVPVNGISKRNSNKPWILKSFGRTYCFKNIEDIENYWLCDGLYLGDVDTRISTNIFKKVYRCDITELRLIKHPLTFGEFKILTSSKELEFFCVHVPVRYDTGDIVTFREIIEYLPNVKYLQYEDPIAASSHENIIKIVNQINNSIQSRTRWLQLGECFCEQKKHLKEYPELECVFGFLNPFLDINAEEFHHARSEDPLYTWVYRQNNALHVLIKLRKKP